MKTFKENLSLDNYLNRIFESLELHLEKRKIFRGYNIHSASRSKIGAISSFNPFFTDNVDFYITLCDRKFAEEIFCIRDELLKKYCLNAEIKVRTPIIGIIKKFFK